MLSASKSDSERLFRYVPIDRLDPALIRPGRMGRHVWFRTPTLEDRKDIACCPQARLPPLLFQAMMGFPVPHAYYLTWPQAVDALAAGLRRLRDLTSLDGPALG